MTQMVSTAVSSSTQDPWVPTAEQLEYMKERAKSWYRDRNYPDSMCFDHFLDQYQEAHQDVWNILKGTRYEQVHDPLGFMQDGDKKKQLLAAQYWGNAEWNKMLEAYNQIRDLMLEAYYKAAEGSEEQKRVHDNYNRVCQPDDYDAFNGYPEWLFTGKLRDGRRPSKAAGSNAKLLELFDKALTFHRFLNAVNIKAQYRISIVTEPHHFLRLGTRPCDERSCYGVRRDHNHAPGHLALSHGSVVFYLKEHDPEKIQVVDGRERDTNKILGRAWGYMCDACWGWSNMYTRGNDGFRNIFKDLLVKTMQSLGYKSEETASFDDMVDFQGCGTELYLNHDGVAYSKNRTFCSFCIETEYLGEPRCTCCCCGCHVDEEDVYNNDAGDPHCCDCYELNYTRCEFSGWEYPADDVVEVHYRSQFGSAETRMVHIDHAVELHDGDYCWPGQEVELYDGRMAWQYDDDLVTLHDGQYALSTDDDVVYLQNGDAALKSDCDWDEDEEVYTLSEGA